ncbi:MAG: rRNA maturation RNase YbeY [Candidatus Omnitrophota bacterium]
MIRLYIRNLQKRLPVDRALVKKIVEAVCSKENPGLKQQISVCLVTDTRIRKLNERFHHCDGPTDVLAFSLSDDPNEVIADIFVSTDTAVAQSRIYRTDPRYEMYLYVIHGLLHIAGYNDLTAAGRRSMRRKEKQYLTICMNQ